MSTKYLAYLKTNVSVVPTYLPKFYVIHNI